MPQIVQKFLSKRSVKEGHFILPKVGDPADIADTVGVCNGKIVSVEPTTDYPYPPGWLISIRLPSWVPEQLED